MANTHSICLSLLTYKKTYDMVNKEVLLSKLLSYGISGRMFHFIRSFLSNRTFQVRIGSALSMTKPLENGTPQGSVLIPRGGSSRRAAGLQPSLKNVSQKIPPNGQTRLKFGF